MLKPLFFSIIVVCVCVFAFVFVFVFVSDVSGFLDMTDAQIDSLLVSLVNGLKNESQFASCKQLVSNFREKASRGKDVSYFEFRSLLRENGIKESQFDNSSVARVLYYWKPRWSWVCIIYYIFFFRFNSI